MQRDRRQVPIALGTEVYDRHSEKVGTVVQHSALPGYLLMQKGIFFPKDLYIPTSAIERVTTDGIFLRLSQHELTEERYTRRPLGHALATVRGPEGADPSQQLDGTHGAQGPLTGDQDLEVTVREEELSD
jgi:hypothetical protein